MRQFFLREQFLLIDLWSLSPKLSSAGENYLRFPIIQSFLQSLQPDQQQWKFVIRDEADMRILQELLTRFPFFMNSGFLLYYNRKVI